MDIPCAVNLLPNWNDEEFGKVKIRWSADEFWNVTQWWWKVVHDACDGGVREGLNLFEMRNGPYGLRRGFSHDEVRANLSECGEFVYICCAELWSGGEDGNGGEWVEPVKHEKALQEGVTVPTLSKAGGTLAYNFCNVASV